VLVVTVTVTKMCSLTLTITVTQKQLKFFYGSNYNMDYGYYRSCSYWKLTPSLLMGVDRPLIKNNNIINPIYIGACLAPHAYEMILSGKHLLCNLQITLCMKVFNYAY